MSSSSQARWLGEDEERIVNTTRLILVGGFLGAGKTTLMGQAATRLARNGHQVAMVTNDQASNLVDTAVLASTGFAVEEVAGGCFCCRFPDLISAANRLHGAAHPDVILAEPVGSCTDLAATVIRPLQQLFGERFRVAPFSVLVDPARLQEAFSPQRSSRFPPHIVYIFRKQIEEADVVIINKVDLLAREEQAELPAILAEHFPGKPVFLVSALTGEGVDEWLDFLAEELPAGQHVAAVDYDAYADGEAALGWLNGSIQLRSNAACDWSRLSLKLATHLQDQLRALDAEIAHLKLRLTTGKGGVVVNLTAGNGTPVCRGQIPDEPAEAVLVINVRAHVDPQRLQAAVEHSLTALGPKLAVAVSELRSFAPGRPQPTYRFGVDEKVD